MHVLILQLVSYSKHILDDNRVECLLCNYQPLVCLFNGGVLRANVVHSLGNVKAWLNLLTFKQSHA